MNSRKIHLNSKKVECELQLGLALKFKQKVD